MKIIVTGSNGFIGKKIVEFLKDTHEVIGIDRSIDALEKGHTFCGDISNKKDMQKILNGIGHCDVVIHCAAKISFDNYEQDIIDINCTGTLNVFKLAVQLSAKQIIYISSIQVLQPIENVILTETSSTYNDSTLYHISKLFGERLLSMPEFSSLKTTILRITAPIAPEMPQNRMLSIFFEKAKTGNYITLHGRGQRIQNYVDTRDIANAVRLAIVNQAEGIYHISGESCSNIEVARRCFRVFNRTPEIIFSDQPDLEENNKWIISTEKSKKQLQYEPQYGVEDVLIEMKEKGC